MPYNGLKKVIHTLCPSVYLTIKGSERYGDGICYDIKAYSRNNVHFIKTTQNPIPGSIPRTKSLDSLEMKAILCLSLKMHLHDEDYQRLQEAMEFSDETLALFQKAEEYSKNRKTDTMYRKPS